MTIVSDLGRDIDLEFSRSNMEFVISAKTGWIATKKGKHMAWTLGLKWPSDVIIGHDLDLEFSRSNMEFAISQQKMSDCHETNWKYVNWTLGLKCKFHQIWPCPWPWLGEMKSKHIELKTSLTIECDLGHDIERWNVRIYRIVPGGTSDVSVPSTFLVIFFFFFFLPFLFLDLKLEKY